MQVVRYAAYGSNLHPRRLRARSPSVELVGTGYLRDCSLYFHKRSVDASGKCNIQGGSNGVYVAVYQMSAIDKRELDRIEGLGAGYLDARIVVPDIGECVTYVAAKSHVDDSLLPYDWYRELVLQGCRCLNLPDEYQQRIKQVAVTSDPDLRRRQDNWNTVEGLRESSV